MGETSIFIKGEQCLTTIQRRKIFIGTNTDC